MADNVKLFYNSFFHDFKNKLWQKTKLSEILLWNKIRDKKIMGYEFRRKVPLKNQIIDFYCSELKLAIHIQADCFSGTSGQEKEIMKSLKNAGITLLMFQDAEVRKNIDHVINTIISKIKNLYLLF